MANSIFGMATRSLGITQSMLDTVGNNISNVNTPGYSRQQVELATEDGQFTGAGFVGRGVKAITVTRATDAALIQQDDANRAQAAANTTRLNKLEQLETVLPTGDASLGNSASQILNAFVDVSNQPQDMAARQVVLARAQEWISRVNSAGAQLNTLQAGVIDDMSTSVGIINGLTAQIAAINDSVAKTTGSGHTANDLLDKRDELIRQLSKQIQVTTIPADDGTTTVSMSGGQILVLGNTAQTLSVTHGSSTASPGLIGLTTSDGTTRTLDSTQMAGGVLKGLLQFQDSDLASTRTQLNNFTSSFANAINQQQALGLDATGTPQTSFDASGNPVNTHPIFINTGAADTIALSLQTPKGLAAANPLVALAPSGNTGTLSVSSLTMQRALPSGTAPDAATSRPTVSSPLNVVFSQDPSNAAQLVYRFVDSTGAGYKDVTPARTWQPGTPINDADPASTPSGALFSINVSGVPRAGDQLTVSTTTYPGSNNGNALAMLQLRDKAISTADGTTSSTITDTYSQMIGTLGVTVQSGKTMADISNTLATNSAQTLSSITGVNLDEEAARLIQYQQSYQASAKMLQVAQSILDTLLRVAGS